MSETQPKISVVIPVYNTEKYLPACLDSVLSQSLEDFEIVAVNDASTDDSARILADYAAGDSRIRIVNHERNRGLLAVRLTGIAAARGKYLLFLDSDDCFLPGFLKRLWRTAEKHQADVVHFPLKIRDRNHTLPARLLRLAEKKSRPWRQELLGKEVFRKYFVENAYGWSAVQKLYLTEICRKAAEYIPDDFCLMGEDFCFYTICSFFAKHYIPLNTGGYVYYLDSGISSGQNTAPDRFLNRQSPLQALRNVKDFLRNQGILEAYQTAFSQQEPRVLAEQFMRWMRYLPAEDRTHVFNTFFRQYDECALFAALRCFFCGRDEHFLDQMTGESPEPVPCPEHFNHVAENPVLQNSAISVARWQEWKRMIQENQYDAVVLPPDENPERLFWDIRAIRDAGAAAVCRREKPHLFTLDTKGLKPWLTEDRVLRQASLILVPDEESARWYRKRNCHAGLSLQNFLPPQKSDQTSAFMQVLEKSELTSAYYRIDPSADGETFVPFFRKLDRLFRKLPGSLRRRMFGTLTDFYNRIHGY